MKNTRSYQVFSGLVCVLATILFMFPLCIMGWRSFQNGGLPNYQKVFDSYNLILNFWASIKIVGGTLIVVAICVSLAAFAFSKLRFPGKKALYYLLLSGMMIPTAATIFPLFQIVKGLNLLGSTLSLILPYATASCCFNLMILKNYYDAIPNEMMQAAHIDGASKRQIFTSIMMPIAMPGLSVVLIQTFLSAWNELQMAKTFITDPIRQPISIIPIRFAQTVSSISFTTEVMYAALVICLIPVVVFYVIAARFLVAGLTNGAIKG